TCQSREIHSEASERSGRQTWRPARQSHAHRRCAGVGNTDDDSKRSWQRRQERGDQAGIELIIRHSQHLRHRTADRAGNLFVTLKWGYGQLFEIVRENPLSTATCLLAEMSESLHTN